MSSAIRFIPDVATREVVSVPSLRVGDLVLVHGVVMRLTSCHLFWCDQTRREVSRFATEFVASFPGIPESVGAGWWEALSENWSVQGNALATAVRVTL